MSENTAAAVMLLVAIAVVLFGGMWATGAAAEANANETRIENEQINRTDEFVTLDTPGDRVHNETVVFASSGDRLADSEYTLRADTGEIRFNESDGETMNVSYTSSTWDGQTGAFVNMLSPLWSVGAFFPLIVAGGAIMAVVRWLQGKGRGGAY